MIKRSTFRRSYIRLESEKGQLFGDQMVNFSIDKNSQVHYFIPTASFVWSPALKGTEISSAQRPHPLSRGTVRLALPDGTIPHASIHAFIWRNPPGWNRLLLSSQA